MDLLHNKDGILIMSYSCDGDGKSRVIDGTLKVYEDRRINADKHNSKDSFDITIKGRNVSAGFEYKPKSLKKTGEVATG